MAKRWGKQALTIRQLAKLCGCSPATVSRVLNHSLADSHATPEMYEKIHDAARQNGYRPNYQFLALRSGRSRCIGLLIGSDMAMHGSHILEGVLEVLNPVDKHVDIQTGLNDRQREARAFDSLLYRGCDGIIHWPAGQVAAPDFGHLKEILSHHQRIPPLLSIGGDNGVADYRLLLPAARLGTAAAERQLEKGCRKFGILEPLLMSSFHYDASEAYRNCLADHGIPAGDIVDIRIAHQNQPEQLEAFRHIEGLWSSYFMLIHSYLQLLGQIVPLRRLHVDGTMSLESFSLYRWLNHTSQTCTEVKRELCAPFASAQLDFFSFFEFGQLAAQRMISLIFAPAALPAAGVEWLPLHAEFAAEDEIASVRFFRRKLE